MTRNDEHQSGVSRAGTPERRVSRPLTIAAAAVAALALGATGLAAAVAPPSQARALGELFLGKTMARAEVVIVKGGTVHDYRLDQGKVVSIRPGAIELLERDGTRQLIPLAQEAQVWINGRLSSVAAIPLRVSAITIRDGDLPAEVIRITGAVKKS
jgi:hypothetical protein